MFGFLFLVFLILVITCSETTILLCYFHLCAEDYHWWWRSFLTSGFTGTRNILSGLIKFTFTTVFLLLHSRLPVRLLLSLLRHKAADQRRGQHVLVLWLHAHYGFPVLFADRIDGLLCLLLVHSKDIQRRESRLNPRPLSLNLTYLNNFTHNT